MRVLQASSSTPGRFYGKITVMPSRCSRPIRIFWLSILLIALGGAVRTLWQRHQYHLQQSLATPALARIPHRVLWVWARPEDLRSIQPANTAIAVLAQTLYLGAAAVPVDRRQPVVFPDGTRRITVVRIEPTPSFAAHMSDPALLRAAVQDLLRVAQQSGIVDFEIDFDATRSQRPFYRALLTQVRRGMPPSEPLSMTALVSWCSYDDWIGNLPVDEAIPMFFRMEPDHNRTSPDDPTYHIREPLCQGSVGVSTHEPWPANIGGRRVYIFPDDGWARDLSLLNNTHPQLSTTALENRP